MILQFQAPFPKWVDTPGPHFCSPARGGPSSSPSPLHPVFQVIIIQSQVQPQPENTAESQAPTEEPSRGSQASSKRKEERPPSQENPEVGGGGLGATVGRAPQGLGGNWPHELRSHCCVSQSCQLRGCVGAVVSSDPGPVCLAWPSSLGVLWAEGITSVSSSVRWEG